MGAGHFFAPIMKKFIYLMLLTAISSSVSAQTTTYTEQGGVVIVVDTSTGAYVGERNTAQLSGGQCNRTDVL